MEFVNREHVMAGTPFKAKANLDPGQSPETVIRAVFTIRNLKGKSKDVENRYQEVVDAVNLAIAKIVGDDAQEG